ncbi:Nephrocystin-3, partial [Lasiodiplodia hormozganensis]
MPVTGRFVGRDSELRRLAEFFLSKTGGPTQRKVHVTHGLGGIGKTQLAVQFARKYHTSFSAVFWLDGSTKDGLMNAFVGLARRIPKGELGADAINSLNQPVPQVEMITEAVLQWLSLPSNKHWLLIFDNVDRDCSHKDRDPQAYDVGEFFPQADHGSILITSRLANLGRRYSDEKLWGVTEGDAQQILLAGSGLESEVDWSPLIQKLDGLPLALAQAASYIRQTKMSVNKYIEYYNSKWDSLISKQDRFPLQEYSNRELLTTWTISYEQAERESKQAAGLLKLWSFLNNNDLWYGLVAAASELVSETPIPDWLLKISNDELEFDHALGILSAYSLVDGTEDSSYSMHSVLHLWSSQLIKEHERAGILTISAGIVASNVPTEDEAQFWEKGRRLLQHGVSLLQKSRGASDISVEPWMLHSLGFLFYNHQSMDYAEEMYQRALAGREKALGPDHRSTLQTVNNLGLLYKNQDKLDKAEEMYQR